MTREEAIAALREGAFATYDETGAELRNAVIEPEIQEVDE
jgi:hypothetical protein